MKNGYVIMSMSVDGETCYDDGVFSGVSFGLVTPKVYSNIDEAFEAMKKIMNNALRLIKNNLDETEDDPDRPDYSVEIEPTMLWEELELNVYYRGNQTSSTHYRVEEIEF